MPLQVTTKPNNLTTSEIRFLFISKNAGKITLDQLLDEAAEAHSTVTRADLAASIHILIEVTHKLLYEGFRIEFPFVDLYLKASGSAETSETPFTPKRKSTDHTFTLHALVHKREQHISAGSVQWLRRDFNRFRFTPSVRKAEIWEDSTIYIEGKNLEFDKTDSRDGICLMTGTGDDKIVPVRYNLVKNTEIIALLPPLEPGTYSLYITNRGNSVLQHIQVNGTTPAGKAEPSPVHEQLVSDDTPPRQ
jgi:hypothetical protein